MIVNNFYINEVKLLEYDPRTSEIKLRIHTSDVLDPILIKTKMGVEIEDFARKVVKKVKELRTPKDAEGFGVLANVKVVTILNSEKVIEGIYKGLVRLDSRSSNLKRIRVASEYLRALDQAKSMQEVLYRKTKKEI